MSNIIGQPGQDLPEPILPGEGDNDVIGRPDNGGIGNDLPTPSERESPLGEPDPTRPDAGQTATDEVNREEAGKPRRGLSPDYDPGQDPDYDPGQDEK